jgi:hypothetical protein
MESTAMASTLIAAVFRAVVNAQTATTVLAGHTRTSAHANIMPRAYRPKAIHPNSKSIIRYRRIASSPWVKGPFPLLRAYNCSIAQTG